MGKLNQLLPRKGEKNESENKYFRDSAIII